MLATCCGQLGKLMLRTDFKTEDLGLWGLILSSHSTRIVSLLLGEVILLSRPLSQVFLFSWGWSFPSWLPKIHSRSIQFCSFLQVQLILYLFYKGFFPKHYWVARKPWSLRLARPEGDKLFNLRDRLITIKFWIIVRIRGTRYGGYYNFYYSNHLFG